MLLRNHGTLTVGDSIAAAFIRMYFLERACTAQVRAQSGGGVLNRASEESIAATAGAADMGLSLVGNGLLWPALIRKLDRTDPSYRD
jgi:ribulose-5-phosphate 4-epimerase/fuculose-1-phosphate aldolase